MRLPCKRGHFCGKLRSCRIQDRLPTAMGSGQRNRLAIDHHHFSAGRLGNQRPHHRGSDLPVPPMIKRRNAILGLAVAPASIKPQYVAVFVRECIIFCHGGPSGPFNSDSGKSQQGISWYLADYSRAFVMTDLLKTLVHEYGILYVSLSKLEEERPGNPHESLNAYYETMGTPL
jgi:hypothetical protein